MSELSFIEKAMIGFSTLGQAVGDDAAAGNALVMVLTDQMKEYICAGLFYRAHERRPNEGEDYMKDERALAEYERMKDFMRLRIQRIIDSAAQEEIRREASARRQQFNTLQVKLRTSNKPHPMGTVDELAKRFNVSKSEIRRRKAAGTLNELQA